MVQHDAVHVRYAPSGVACTLEYIVKNEGHRSEVRGQGDGSGAAALDLQLKT